MDYQDAVAAVREGNFAACSEIASGFCIGLSPFESNTIVLWNTNVTPNTFGTWAPTPAQENATDWYEGPDKPPKEN